MEKIDSKIRKEKKMTLRTLSEDPFPYIKLLDTLLNPPLPPSPFSTFVNLRVSVSWAGGSSVTRHFYIFHKE